jgi:crotonobetainyl-CoA:carnitine CoA-transferase CaiB-like acyl-CoA transferase
MTAMMRGVRILEDRARRAGRRHAGLASSGTVSLVGNMHVLLEHYNHGKQSLGLDLTSPDGLDILYRLAATCDVFLTNKLPSVRRKLQIDVDDLRAHSPDIVYVRGHGQGDRGPDADRGSYDSLSYWCRSGIALGIKQHANVPPPPGPAFGDSIGAMAIAGAIMGALFHRERSGEATVVQRRPRRPNPDDRAFALGAVDFVNKPFAGPDLLERLDRALHDSVGAQSTRGSRQSGPGVGVVTQRPRR